MRFRRLPVAEEGRLLGIVSIGDMVRAMVDGRQAEVRGLHNCIAGGPVA
ncbi:MAG: CBS domain-containing protein [Planctomycetes bacterium]|nr:CBS domain-containing protein [Planctomycetota bacterium]